MKRPAKEANTQIPILGTIEKVAVLNFEPKRKKRAFDNVYKSIFTFASIATIYNVQEATPRCIADILLRQCRIFKTDRYRGAASERIHTFQLIMARLGRPLPRDVTYLIVDMVYASEVDAAAEFEERALRFMRHGCLIFRRCRFTLDDVLRTLRVKSFRELYETEHASYAHNKKTEAVQFVSYCSGE